MTFAKQLRDGVRKGEITLSVRFWHNARVKVGHQYEMEEGSIEIDSIDLIGFPDITPQLALASGFLGVLDLLKTAKHGSSEKIYLVRFHYIPPAKPDAKLAAKTAKRQVVSPPAPRPRSR